MKTILVDAVCAFVVPTDDNTFEICGALYRMLEEFPNRKVILTGADDEQFKKFRLASMPYEVFTLKHNPEKSDPVYYERMLEHFSLNAEEVVYFEHNPDAVLSAQSVGIITHLWDNDLRPVDELREFLKQNI